MATAAFSSSLPVSRGVVEDHPSATTPARPGGTWASSFVELSKTKASLPVARATVAAITPPPPSRFQNDKRRDGTTGLPIPVPLDQLGIRQAGTPRTSDESWQRERQPVSAEMLDRWIRGSVTDIVQRIEEAPFLSFIFANNDTDVCYFTPSSTVRIEREARAEADDWQEIQRRWGSSSPDGVILVEELKGHQLQDELKERGFGNGLGSAATRTWGVLVQGRGGGAECTACYVLNTCRVLSDAGCCTHFCLVRAEYSGETAEAQLREAWLAYGHRCWQQY